MDNLFQQITHGGFGAVFDRIGSLIDNFRRKRRLKQMLLDKRFPKGFRSIQQLSSGIGCDVEKTKSLLLAIRARKSETTDEWTLKK